MITLQVIKYICNYKNICYNIIAQNDQGMKIPFVVVLIKISVKDSTYCQFWGSVYANLYRQGIFEFLSMMSSFSLFKYILTVFLLPLKPSAAKKKTVINTESDPHLISPYNVTRETNFKVRRIYEMVTN